MRYAPDFSSRFRILKGGKISLVVSALLAGSTMTFASPTGGTVTTGSATISQSGSSTTINQSSNKASINWQSFSIAPSETVNFVQPSAQSVTLNRVVGATQSLIEGAMNANGQVFLINPNGVVFAQGSQVNVGGLVASTLNITDANFQAGNYVFEGNSQNSILNMGTITAANGGYVALMGKTVQNQGTIVATMGNAQLAAGDKMTLNLNGNSLLGLTIDQGTLNALVENGGLIKADGGQVYLTTQAINDILNGMVNNTGIIEAQSLNNVNGKIVLFAHGGTANIGGTIKAEGGFVETSGKEFAIQKGATIKAADWLIDPANVTIDQIMADAIETQLNSGNVTVETTATGPGNDTGDITVSAGVVIEPHASNSRTLTLKADRSIVFEEGATIDALPGYEPLNVYLSAHNYVGDFTSTNRAPDNTHPEYYADAYPDQFFNPIFNANIILRNATIKTNGGNLIIGGALDNNGVPTTSGIANQVNIDILGSTLNANYNGNIASTAYNGNIIIGGERVNIGESYAASATYHFDGDVWAWVFDDPNNYNDSSVYTKSSIIGKDISIISTATVRDNQYNNSVYIDGTDITASNSLTLKSVADVPFDAYWRGYTISFEGMPYRLGNEGFLFSESSIQSLKSTITFTGGNHLTLDSANNILFNFAEDKQIGEGAKPTAIGLEFSGAADVSIKTLQAFSLANDGANYVNNYGYSTGNGLKADLIDIYGTSTMWDGAMFQTAGHYDLRNGTVQTQMFSDGSVVNGFAEASYTPYKFENSYIAFGNGFNNPINQYGMLRSPFYWNGSEWKQLSFGDLPVSVVIGVWGDGTDEWNLNGTIVSSLESSADFVNGAFGQTTLDRTNLNSNGTGTIIAITPVTIGDQTFELKNTYYLPITEKFVRTDTTFKNVDGPTADNVRLWIGLQDDYLAGYDWAIDRTRGNLVNGSGFVPTDPASYATERSHSILFGTNDTGVLFHTTSSTGAGFITTYDWNSQLEFDTGYYSDLYSSGRFNSVSPADSFNTLAADLIDAGYGVFNRYPNLTTGQSANTRWYYGVASISDINNVADAVGNDVITNPPSNGIVTPPSNSGGGSSSQEEQTVNDVVTTIVNQASVVPPRIPTFTPPTAPNTAGQEASRVLVNAIYPGQDLGLVSSPNGEQPVRSIESNELLALATSKGMNELRVPLGNDSMVDLVNGGLNLPKGVNQEFYVVSNSDSTQGNGNNKAGSDKDDKKTQQN